MNLADRIKSLSVEELFNLEAQLDGEASQTELFKELIKATEKEYPTFRVHVQIREHLRIDIEDEIQRRKNNLSNKFR